MTDNSKLRKASEQLHIEMERLSNVKIDSKPMDEKERVQMREILSGMNKYIQSGDKTGLQKFLIHKKNELRTTIK